MVESSRFSRTFFSAGLKYVWIRMREKRKNCNKLCCVQEHVRDTILFHLLTSMYFCRIVSISLSNSDCTFNRINSIEYSPSSSVVCCIELRPLYRDLRAFNTLSAISPTGIFCGRETIQNADEQSTNENKQKTHWCRCNRIRRSIAMQTWCRGIG